MIRQMIAQALRGGVNFREKDVRAAITVGYDPTAGYDNSGEEDSSYYPEAPANTFWVKLCKTEFTKAAGSQDIIYTPYSPPEYRLARHLTGEYQEEGTEVWITLVHGQYYILPQGTGGRVCSIL
jgi:hypothetical protein